MKNQDLLAPISETESLAACKTVLASDKFVNAPRMSRLLRFLVDSAISGNTRNTSEYAIGIEVFDRNASTYSTTEDPAVRVQVGRLREKLKDYYSSVASEIEISIPLGSYMPIFLRNLEPNLNTVQTLIFRPIRSISELHGSQPFAQGLHEEILHQLFSVLNRFTIIQQLPTGDENYSNESNSRHKKLAKHLLEGFVRFDSQRIRTSIRLFDLEHNQLCWSKQYDRRNCYDISDQEELAFTICQELKKFMIQNEMDYFESELSTTANFDKDNRIAHISRGQKIVKHSKSQTP